MSAVTAHITSAAVTLTSKRKGEIGNYLGFKQILDPAGATGATTVSVSGLEITVKLKNDGALPTATIGEVFSAISGSAAAQLLVTAVQAGNTGATGVAFTGSGGAFVRGISGAEGTGTVEYDDLAAATGAGWVVAGLSLEKVRADGTIERQSSLTGATQALAAGRTQTRRAAKGLLTGADW